MVFRNCRSSPIDLVFGLNPHRLCRLEVGRIPSDLLSEIVSPSHLIVVF